MAVLGTQVLATLIAVHGAYVMTPLGWRWALFVWVYALAWFLLNDRLKLLANKRDVPYQSLLKMFVAERLKAEFKS